MGMEKEEGRYLVHLGLKRVGDRIVMANLKEEVLKEEIDRMMPEGFFFKDGVFSSRQPSYGVWTQRRVFVENSIHCEIIRKHLDYRTPDGFSTWYWTYRISIWYSIGKFLGFSLGDQDVLDTICRDVAQMIEDKYS